MNTTTTIEPIIPAAPTRTQQFFITLRRNPSGLIGIVMLSIILFIAIFAPFITPYDPFDTTGVTSSDLYNPPSSAHWFGTDDAGKDILSSFILGSRVSLIVGFFAAFISIALGGVLGVIAGFYGGRTENVLMRLTDIMLVIPDLPLMVVIIALTKPSLLNIIFVIGIFGWTTTARITRSQTLAVKSRNFVLRAKAIGAGNFHIIRHHILPLVLPLLVVQAVLTVSTAILSESTLSFLGLGDPTAISWGQMLNFAFSRGAMSSGAWWALVVPGFGIIWVVLGLVLLGQGLEQVLNPKLDTHHLSPGRPIVQKEAAEQLPDKTALLEVRNVSIDYVNKDQPAAHAVENVSFTLNKGELMGLVGESGCGKTTLVMSILQLLPSAGQIVNGRIFFDGRELTALSNDEINEVRWKGISIIFQGAMNALNPVRPVGEQIAEAILKHNPGYPQENIRGRVIELLEMVGITADHKDHFPHQYSGGMRQRAVIAMALACDPKVIIADEPTTALDVMIQAQILELLDQLRKKLGLAVIFVTHDLGVVAEMCDRVMVMYGGVTAEYAGVDTIYNEPQHPYTQELLKAFPDLSKPRKRLSSIPGYPPRLDALPPGCRFAPRCPAAFERCHTEQPKLHKLGDGHWAGCHLVEAKK